VNAISEIALNCLKGNVPLNSNIYKKLIRYKNILRQLSKRSSVIRRKKLINQKGGFLQLLLPPALSLIASIAGEIIGKRIRK